MAGKSPPLHFVRAFECAARHMSFTRAARELGLTQAAISQQVRALEDHVGQPLFRRGARSLKLTEAGEALLPALRQAIGQIDSATQAVLAGARGRSLAISCPVSLAAGWLSARLSAFRLVHPSIDVTVQGTVWEDRDGPAGDLVISIDREGEAPPDSTPLWQERLALVASPAFAAGLQVPADIETAPKIFIQGRQEYWLAVHAALGLSPPDFSRGMRVNVSMLALELAASGAGAAVLPLSLAEAAIASGRLTEPFAVRPKSPWTYSIRRTRANPAAQLLEEFLKG
jgi:LysR family glycine cleavage system transcriptional activator